MQVESSSFSLDVFFSSTTFAFNFVLELQEVNKDNKELSSFSCILLANEIFSKDLLAFILSSSSRYSSKTLFKFFISLSKLRE